MFDSPKLEDRSARSYVAIPVTVALADEPATIPVLLDELRRWMEERHIEPGGPPFVRYLVINMPARLEIEVALPFSGDLQGDHRVIRGELPAGSYATMVHTGPVESLVDANASLQKWAEERGITGETRETGNGTAWTARVETYLTNPKSEPDSRKHRTEIAYLVREIASR